MSCEEASPFGVKRPLRFLSEALSLSDAQHTAVAEILADLKTERAQADVHRRRSIGLLADAFVSPANADFAAALALREQGDAGVRSALVKSMRALHTALDAGQRGRLSHLLRTGQLQV